MKIKKLIDLRKSQKYLKKCKFTIDQNQILNGDLEMFPDIKIYYAQSKNDLNIFEIRFINRYYEDENYKYYYDIYYFQHDYILTYSGYLNKVYNFDVLGTWDDINKIIYSFAENCLPTDIYEYDDFINILKRVSCEITNYLYKTGDYQINDDNCISQVNNDSNFELLSSTTVKKLIKKAHREYMDNKVLSSTHDDK